MACLSYFICELLSRRVNGNNATIMPSAVAETLPPLKKWQRPEKTSVDLPWADIQTIDISNFEAPGEKQRLAEQLRKAVSISSQQQTRIGFVFAKG